MYRNWDNFYPTVSSRFLTSVSSFRWSDGWDFEDCSNFRTHCKSSRRPAGGEMQKIMMTMLKKIMMTILKIMMTILKKSWLRGAMWAGKILSFFFCEFNPNSKIVSSCSLGIACGPCLHIEGGPLKVWELALEEPAVNKHTYIVPAMSCTVFNYQQRQGIKESFEVGGLPPSLTLCPHIA